MNGSMFKNIKVQISIALTSIFTLIGIGTVCFKIFEDWTWIQCFYFSVTTLTTVGFGDFHPTSEGSRLFTAFYILIGVTIVLGSIGVIGSNYIIRREERILMKRKKQ
jgi:voltage-gated potassium channel